MKSNIPTTIYTETFIIKDLVLMGLTSLMNVNISDTLGLLNNIDDRINQKKLCPVTGLSRQIYSAYTMYIQYLPILDNNQYNKYER